MEVKWTSAERPPLRFTSPWRSAPPSSPANILSNLLSTILSNILSNILSSILSNMVESDFLGVLGAHPGWNEFRICEILQKSAVFPLWKMAKMWNLSELDHISTIGPCGFGAFGTCPKVTPLDQKSNFSQTDQKSNFSECPNLKKMRTICKRYCFCTSTRTKFSKR